MLNIDQIRGAHGPKTFEIPVPEWNGSVLVRRLTAQAYIDLNNRPLEKGNQASEFDYMLGVVQWSLINEDESPLISDDNLYLLTDSPMLVARLGQEILKANKLLGNDSGNSPGSPS